MQFPVLLRDSWHSRDPQEFCSLILSVLVGRRMGLFCGEARFQGPVLGGRAAGAGGRRK